MSHKPRLLTIAAVIALAVPVLSGGVAGASDEHRPGSATVKIKGVETFRPNFYQNTFRFPEDPTVVRKGGTVTFDNLTTQAHAMSLVAKGDLPTSNNGNDVSNALNNAHFPAGPPLFVLDAGIAPDPGDTTPDFDTVSHSNPSGAPSVGDSVIVDDQLGSHGGSPTITVQMTGPAGLYHYFCIFHDWMQGEIRVVN
jgi:plastocyanin